MRRLKVDRILQCEELRYEGATTEMKTTKKQHSRPKSVQIHVDSLQAMGERFINAWHRAEKGHAFNEEHVTVVDPNSTLNPPAATPSRAGRFAKRATRPRPSVKE